ncbi:MAG: carboxypeptidase regulatory-like domain-containing protein [Verrucomicrobia bacterium]|nr:carboxypeptidase regulatory-like domain-containing protein [Verrucomicrobiota bacterium]
MSDQTATANLTLAPNAGSVLGQITDAVTGQAVASATINLSQNGSLVTSATTDSRGAYTLSGLVPGSYVLQVSASHYQSGSAGVTIVSDQTATANLALTPNAGSVSGQITDAVTGQAVAGVTINVIKNSDLISSGTTDSRGYYNIGSLAPNSYVIQTNIAHYQMGSSNFVIISDQTATINLSLVPHPGQIRGQITDSLTNQPIIGASVIFLQNNKPISSGITDEKGSYSISNLTPGIYQVQVSAAHYQVGSTNTTVISDETVVASLVLIPNAGSASGQITDAVTSQPISSATITVLQNGVSLRSATTDEKGNYLLSNLLPGMYTMQISASHYKSITNNTVIVSDQVTITDAALVPNTGNVSGSVIDITSKLAITNATIDILKGSTLISSAPVNDSGYYEISGLVPGYYTVRVNAHNYRAAVVTVTVQSDQIAVANFSLLQDPRSIEGTVVSQETGLPISGVLVEVKINNGVITSTLTDDQGQYTLAVLPPGSYTVYAYKSRYQTGVAGIVVVAEQEIQVNFSLLSSPGVISGVIKNEQTGLPIAGTHLEVILNNGTFYSTITTDAKGRYKMTGMPEGFYTICAHARTYQTATVGVIVQAGKTTIVNLFLLSDPGVLTGTVTSAVSGLPLANTLVAVKLYGITIYSTFTDAFGVYTINGIAPEIYVIQAYASGYQSSNVSAEVLPDQSIVKDFLLLSDPCELTGQVIASDTAEVIAGALVEVSLGQSSFFSTLTNDEGRYSICGVSPGMYALTVRASGYQVAEQSITTVEDQMSRLDFALLPDPSTVEVKISDFDTSQPVSGIFITAIKNNTIIATAVTDKNGYCRIADLSPGDYVLQARNYNYNDKDVAVTLQSNATQLVELIMIANNSPPREVVGQSIQNHFLFQTEIVHLIQWKASASSCICQYKIYRDGVLVKTIPFIKPLSYDEHYCRGRNVYWIVAVTSRGVESAPVVITLN